MKKKILKIFIILILVSGIGASAFYGINYYLNKEKNKNTVEGFYKYIFQNNFSEVFDYGLEKKVIEKLETKPYESNIGIEFTNTIPIDFSLSLDKLTADITNTSDGENKESDIKLSYSNNSLVELSMLSNSKYIALKNSNILKSYIGSNRKSFGEELSKLDTNIGSMYNNIESLTAQKIEGNNEAYKLDNLNFEKEIKKCVKSDLYGYEGKVTIERNGKKIDAEGYSLTLSKNEFMNMYSAISLKLFEDDELISSIGNDNSSKKINMEDLLSNVDYSSVFEEEQQNEIHALKDAKSTSKEQIVENFSKDSISETESIKKFGELTSSFNLFFDNLNNYKDVKNGVKYSLAALSGIRVNESSEKIKDNLAEIFENINNLLDENISENDQVKIIVYESEGKTVKTIIKLGEVISLDLDFIDENIEGTNNYTLKISFLKADNELSNGYTINITKIRSNALSTNIIECEKIENSKVINKIGGKLVIEGSEDTNNYKNSFSFSYTGSGNQGKFTLDLNNKLLFNSSNPQKIDEENTLLLENLEVSNFNYTMNKLCYRIDKLYKENLSKLNLINTNTSDKIVQNNSNKNQISEEEKNQIIDLLVQVVSEEMTKAEEEGREYTIQDLKTLDIEGHDVQVSVGKEFAIVTIDQLEFKIDKEFNLSE